MRFYGKATPEGIADEKGLYKHEFTLPQEWQGRQILLVFEAAFTEIRVQINGRKAGNGTYQGGFTRHTMDVSDRVFFGKKKDKPLSMPSFIIKTDEVRVESIPQILEGDNTWLVTEKLDGTSATYYVNRKSPKSKHFEFGVCSRNIRQKSPAQADYHMQTSGAKTNSYWDIVLKYNIEDILRNYATRNGVKTLVLQGEIIGENIQKNPYKIKGIDFYAFNLYIDGERIGTEELELFCKEYHLNCVPIVDYRHKLPKTMEEMKLEADGFSRLNNEVKREGFVYRSLDGKQSFKNVSREYLLKHS
jgi:RNA ligase (TIGR02306 family)